MAIGFERQQKSLIGANLPQARLDITAPDLSGLQRLGNTMVNVAADKAQRKKAEADANQEFDQAIKGSEDGAAYGQSWVGVDENGNRAEFTVPPGSLPYRRAFLQAAENSLDNRFRNDVNAGFNRIQQEFANGAITAVEAQGRMQSYLDGQLENTPVARRGIYAEIGRAELLQRTGLMGTQEASRKEQALAGDQEAIIKDRVSKASSHSAAGGDASPFYAEIDKAYDTLVGLNRMGKEEAEIGKKNVRQLVTGQALVNRLTVAMAKGEVDPLAIDRFGTAIETNDSSTEIIVNKTYQVGPNARSSVPYGYRSKDVFNKVEDEALRKEMGQMLRQAATDWKQQAVSNAKVTDFSRHMSILASPRGRTMALDPSYRDTANEIAANILVTADPFTNSKGRGDLIWQMGTTKFAPRPVVDALLSMINSGDPEKARQAVDLYREMIYLKNEQGDLVGATIKASIPNEAVVQLDNFEQAYRSLDIKTVQQNQQKARDNPQAFEIDTLITQYNATRENGNFYNDFRDRWEEEFGDPNVPAEASEAFRRVYRQSMITLGNPTAAFDAAYGIVKSRFVQSPIMLTGWQTVTPDGMTRLTNPPGTDPEPGWLGFQQSGAEYDWINNSTRDTLLRGVFEGNLALPTLPGNDEPMSAAEFRGLIEGDGYFLGKTVKLAPVPGSNPEMPEYMLHVFTPGGDYLGPLYRKGEGGSQPFTINPHAEHANISFKWVKSEELGKAEKGAADAISRLETDYMLKLRATNPDAFYGWDEEIPIKDYLPKVSEELSKQYNLDRKMIEDGLESARKTYEQQTGEKPPAASMGPQSLLVPKAAGFEVASSAAAIIDDVLPDGTGGAFMLRVAAQESDFGMAAGTYRMIGDKGMMQTNTRSSYLEVKRQVALGKGRVFEAARRIKDQLGIDIATITEDDLDKPLVSMAVARLYVEAVGQPVPKDVAGQAAYWKRHYNTVAGAGTVDQFIRSAGKVPDDWARPTIEQADASGVKLRYTNQSAKRSLAVTPTLEMKLKTAVASTLGPGYAVEIYSGGQAKGISNGMAGTDRHNDEDGLGGRAADVYVIGPNGKRVTDAGKLLKLRRFWLASGYGSVGHFMKGMGMHFDEITADQLKPGQSLTWRY